jgi:uncharacterized membrane protein
MPPSGTGGKQEQAMSVGFLLGAVFLACLVEAVEALTVVLAVGVTRGWPSSLAGVGAGIVALGVLVAVLGPALRLIPLDGLRLVVGGLLLIFGLGWLRKAILRAAGLKDRHDEEAIYARQTDAAGQVAAAAAAGAGGWDGYAIVIAFKAVTLEGLEVVFIVLSFGANQGHVGLAAAGAGAAVLVVTASGVLARAPLSRVPENTLKYVVGLLLVTFGTFWGAAGAGATWPGDDLAIPVLLGAYALTALAQTAWLRRDGPRAGHRQGTREVAG